jgi:hypothetical protein
VVEVVVEEYLNQDHLKQPDRTYPHQEEKLKLWDNSYKSSLETEAKLTTLSMNFGDTSD